MFRSQHLSNVQQREAYLILTVRALVLVAGKEHWVAMLIEATLRTVIWGHVEARGRGQMTAHASVQYKDEEGGQRRRRKRLGEAGAMAEATGKAPTGGCQRIRRTAQRQRRRRRGESRSDRTLYTKFL